MEEEGAEVAEAEEAPEGVGGEDPVEGDPTKAQTGLAATTTIPTATT